MPKLNKAQQEENARLMAHSLSLLRKYLPVGSPVYYITRRVSPTGNKVIDLVCPFTDDNGRQSIVWLSGHVSRVLGYRLSKSSDNGILTDGYGSDLVYELGRVMWPEGARLVKDMYGRNGDNSGYETDGGYLLRAERL